jgi:hypothetical protein
MTAAEGTPRASFGERFFRAASVFLDPRVLIILLLGFSQIVLMGTIAFLRASPRQESPLA